MPITKPRILLSNPDAVREHFLDQLSESSAEVRRSRLYWANLFLKYAQGRDFSEWDRPLVDGFMSTLVNLKSGTQRKAFEVVKRVFDSAKVVFEQEKLKAKMQAKSSIDRTDPARALLEIDALDDEFAVKSGPVWGYGKRSAFQVDAGDEYRPTLAMDEVERLIKTAKDGKLDEPESVYLAIASVYGLRRGELGAIRKEHIDLKKGTLWVDTEKGGDKRDQLLAKEILPFIRRYKFTRLFTPYMMSTMWKSICYKAKVESPKGHNWHVWRRFLATELRNRMASDPDVKKDYDLMVKLFLRWSLSSSSDMTIRYWTEHKLEADAITLRHNPCVELWRE